MNEKLNSLTDSENSGNEDINDELLHAKNIILKFAAVAMQHVTMRNKFREIEASSDITKQDTLFMLALAVNLTIYYFSTNNNTEKNFYQSKIQILYKKIQQQKILNKNQKAKWCTVLGQIYYQIEMFQSAINYYELAITLEKEFLEVSTITSQNIQKNNIMIIRSTIALANYLRKKITDLEIIERKYHNAITYTDTLLECCEPSISFEAYYLKSRAQLFSSNHQKFYNKFPALNLAIEATLSAIAGLKIFSSKKLRSNYLKHIQACIKHLVQLILKNKGAIVFSKRLQEYENSLTLLSDTTLDELKTLLTNIKNEVFTKQKSGFWTPPYLMVIEEPPQKLSAPNNQDDSEKNK